MRQWIFLIFVLLVLLGLIATMPFAQEMDTPVNDAEEALPAPFQIELPISQSYEDYAVYEQRRNIFTIHIIPVGAQFPSSQNYTVIIYLDELYIAEFENKTLPFTFPINLIGQDPGRHEIKVEIKQGKHMVAGQTITLYVKGK